MRYSYVLRLHDNFPFDRPEFRWQSFVGEFVIPIVQLQLHKHYWFSYYGGNAKFRIVADDSDRLQEAIIKQISDLQLVDEGDENGLTLSGDLGTDRFLSSDRRDKISDDRALLVIKYLNSICDLYIDNLIKKADGYWELERSNNNENPLGNNFESLAHLLANITQFEFNMEFFARTPWMQPQLVALLRGHL
jgi:hypothetical protein